MTIGKTTTALLALFFVASGAMSTLLFKWQDKITVLGETFGHPFCQSIVMFLGEGLCLGMFVGQLAHRKHVLKLPVVPGDHTTLPVNRLLFAVPAMCDAVASTVLFFALTLTTASAYQMLRGATVLFTGLLSRVVLKRRFQAYQWLGIGLVIVGLVLVGLASTLFDNSSDKPKNALLGNVLVVSAQVVVAIQMVIEEKLYSKYHPHPLQLTGWEGVFGSIVMITIVSVMLAVPEEHRPDDASVWLRQMGQSGAALGSILLMFISTPTFNVCGQAITKYLSSTTRMVLDTLRNIVVWVFAIAISWETFNWLQLAGFIVLVSGTGVYKNIIEIPIAMFRHKEGLIDDGPLDETLSPDEISVEALGEELTPVDLKAGEKTAFASCTV